MASSTNALQQAVYQTLSSDAALSAAIGTDGIFDRRITGKPMPYLAIADIVTSDMGNGNEEHILTLEAWSDADGRRQVQEIAGRVKALLHDASPALTGFHLVNLQQQRAEVRREARTRAFCAEMRFRAVTE